MSPKTIKFVFFTWILGLCLLMSGPLRAQVVARWMQNGFWLMSDDLIARIACVSRQTITKAVKELALIKHRDSARRPIVKGVDENGVFIFREGYPLKS